MTRPDATSLDLLRRALQAHQRGEVSQAEQLYSRLLAQDPRNFDALHLLGVIRAQQKRFAEADSLIAKALEINISAGALNNHAGVLVELGRLEEAASRARRALAMKPAFAEAHYNLGNALRKLGQHEEAASSLAEAIRLRPNYVDAHLCYSQVLRRLDRKADAISTLRRGLAANPRIAALHNNLGILLHETGDAQGARQAFEAAIAQMRRDLLVRPQDAEAHFTLGKALVRCGRIEEAAQAFAEAYRIDPGFADALVNLAGALRELGRHQEIIAFLRREIAIKPQEARLHNALGAALQEAGEIDDARAAFDRALVLDPALPEALYYKAYSAKVAAADDIIPRLEAMVHKPALSLEARVTLHFALGKAKEDVGRYDEAFAGFLEGNRLARTRVSYNEANSSRGFQSLRNVFTKEMMAAKAGVGSPSDLPIFIVGFPRSGTTLTEQILASHPSVFGAGERGYIGELAAAPVLDVGGVLFPESLSRVPPETLRMLGDSYAERLRREAPAARHITDKLPENFMFLGFIRLILPQARIIHVMRDALDTCLSCFALRFRHDNVGYAYDLGELGRYYRMYLDLMEHWRRIMPEGSMLEVQYEDVIENVETEARRIVEYCGLAWDDRCLAFDKTERTVRTASYTQVRQPIYRSSVQRWRRYERHLGPLLEALGEPAILR